MVHDYQCVYTFPMVLAVILSQSAPVLIYGDGGPGSVYVGEVPPASSSRPVVVFVHGKASSPDMWYNDNNMYSLAYSYGYRTAFVKLDPEASMWNNGSMLNNLLNVISNYYGTSNLVIVAHSKGGVDSETAIFHFGNSKVKQVLTLSTPYWGSPLADLAYSTWLGWLAALLGLRTDAAYVLQTGYMAWFRSITDPLYYNNPVPTYSYSSWFDGTPFTWPWRDNFCLSPICWGQWYLSNHGGSCSEGGNDGAVTYSSAHKPTSINLAAPCASSAWKFNHYEIAKGYNVWDRLVINVSATRHASSRSERSPFLTVGSSYYFADPNESLKLEGDFYVLVFGADESEELITSIPYTDMGLQRVPIGNDLFAAKVFRFEGVKSGKYTFALRNDNNLPIMIAFDGDPAYLSSDRMVYTYGDLATFTIRVPHGISTIEGVIRNTKTDQEWPIVFRGMDGEYTAVFHVPREEGVYNVSVSVKGNGYYRSLTKSIMVVKPDPRKPEAGVMSLSIPEGKKFEIYDVSGRKVKEGIASSGSSLLRGLRKGAYILKIEGEGSRRIIVR